MKSWGVFLWLGLSAAAHAQLPVSVPSSNSVSTLDAVKNPPASSGGAAGHTADTLAWKASVIGNGGATPSEATMTAMDGFVNSVAGIKSELIWINLIAPDSKIAAETPLYSTAGINPSTGSGWTGTLSTAGIGAGIGNMSTGIDPSVTFSTSDMGLIVYAAYPSGNPAIAFGGGNGSNCAEIYGTSNPNYFLASYTAWNINGTSITVSTGDYVYFSGQRTSASALTYYIANGNNAWASHGTSSGASGSPPSSGTGANSIGWQSSGVCGGISVGTVVSFMGVTHGQSSADGQTLFNAVQAFRTAIGGGKT